MHILLLPPELRLRIYEYLPELSPNRYEISAYSKLTPSICRVSRTLRVETVPILASNSQYVVELNDAGRSWEGRIFRWLNGLGPDCISRIRSLQISQHWSIPQPQRWQGHVGFYIRIESRKPKRINSRSSVASSSIGSFRPEWNDRFVRPMTEGIWEVTTGTYPIARDTRGMRLESVELLAENIRHYFHVPTPTSTLHPDDECGSEFGRQDIEFLIKAMDVVASHPISTYHLEQAESARRRRHEIWTTMEKQLRALSVQSMRKHVESEPGARLLTPH